MESQPQNLELRNNLENVLPNSVFLGGLSMESQSQNPEFINNPENLHSFIDHFIKY